VERCDDCGFVYADQAVEDLPGLLREGAAAVAAALAGVPGARLRAHPLAGTWSALEYACHVRDVLDVQHGRLQRALVEDRPRNVPMRRDERVSELRYNDQPVGAVVADLSANAERLAAAFAALDEGQRARVLVYGWPTEAERDLVWVARHTVHELVHHRGDIERVLVAGG
jgi:S-DNA-T family DNA segregation ATPase FtsK/SpoIIIE